MSRSHAGDMPMSLGLTGLTSWIGVGRFSWGRDEGRNQSYAN